MLEGDEPSWASKKLTERKYLDFRTLALKQFGSITIRQACLASNRLKSSMSLKPTLPINLGFIISSRETQLVFLSPCLLPHQNLQISEFICSHKPWGNLKQDIE
jgi:hypothetical protein